tara:strand:- start:26520 stop:28289 length:1770 start_codon:yes stop_codon:yes gene_type:complete
MKKLEKFKLWEAPQKGEIVFTFGRFNPPTTGHEKLIDKVKKVSGSSDYKIFPSFSQNQKKDPLPHTLKIAYMRKMFPKHARNIIADKKAITAMDIAVLLHGQGYTELTMVVGSDRVREFETLLKKYNGVKGKRHGFYNFKNIKVVSAGDRDPDSEGVSGMSASKMRQAAIDSNMKDFESGLPKGFRDGKKLYRDVRKHMNIREEKNMGVMDQYEYLRDQYLTGKIWNIDDVVEANNVSGKIITRGTNYIAFADANNKVHKTWLYDIAEVKQDKDIKDREGTQPAKYYAKDADGDAMSKSTKQKRAAHFAKKKDGPAPGDASGETKPSKHTKKYQAMFGKESFEELNEKIDGLVKKAEKSGMPYSILKKVYDRGMAAWKTGHRPGTTPQQWAFARVNSFITKSSGTWGKADKDLAQKVKGEAVEGKFSKFAKMYDMKTKDWEKWITYKSKKNEQHRKEIEKIKDEAFSYPNEYAKHTKKVTPGEDKDNKKYKKIEMAQVTEWYESEETRDLYKLRYGAEWESKLNETFNSMKEKVGKVDTNHSDGVTRVKSFSGKSLIKVDKNKRITDTQSEPEESMKKKIFDFIKKECK